jgi:hypothetical protein
MNQTNVQPLPCLPRSTVDWLPRTILKGLPNELVDDIVVDFLTIVGGDTIDDSFAFCFFSAVGGGVTARVVVVACLVAGLVTGLVTDLVFLDKPLLSTISETGGCSSDSSLSCSNGSSACFSSVVGDSLASSSTAGCVGIPNLSNTRLLY